ncbi:hypothetical protein V1264_023668 [Littorina saxatilis]|uniref:A-kinase anchor protein 7-like phosphoesterase domain-containing protein n=3 Tax=Littorina saxatilis TaxID=31220 RepID=A0AAN9GA06_9CAEN
MKVEAVSHHKPSSVPETKKGKRSVLPAALLNQIVKTVQSNVRTISTQVVAASAVKSPEKPTPACENSENPRFCKTSSDGAAKDNARQDAVQDIVPVMQKERLVKKISVSNMKVEGSEVDSSDTSRQGDGKQQKACERGTMVKDTERLTSSKTKEQSLHNAKSQKSNKSLLHADEMPVKPAELEGASTYEKAKTKSKKANRKTNTRGHKRSGADYHESPLGVLPEYIPENDSRLNKTSEPGRVYNLSTLFSGKLGEGRREQTKRKRPNYFFAVQITNTEVKENLTRLQKDVEEAEPKLKPAFVSVDSAHITLGIMHLGDQEAINRAKAGLHDFQTSHHQQQHHLQLQLSEGEEGEGFGSSDPLVLEVRGLDHFNNNVVFAKVTQGDSLKKLEAIADLLKSCALKQKINLDEKEFAAHLTVMKHSKNPAKLKKSGIKKISSDVYQASRDKIFGVELVTTVQLCSMLKPKKNNYYHIEHEVSLTLKAVSDECATDDG